MHILFLAIGIISTDSPAAITNNQTEAPQAATSEKSSFDEKSFRHFIKNVKAAQLDPNVKQADIDSSLAERFKEESKVMGAENAKQLIVLSSDPWAQLQMKKSLMNEQMNVLDPKAYTALSSWEPISAPNTFRMLEISDSLDYLNDYYYKKVSAQNLQTLSLADLNEMQNTLDGFRSEIANRVAKDHGTSRLPGSLVNQMVGIGTDRFDLNKIASVSFKIDQAQDLKAKAVLADIPHFQDFIITGANFMGTDVHSAQTSARSEPVEAAVNQFSR